MALEPRRGRPLSPVRRVAMISVRLTDAEYATVLADALAAREDLADYVRRRLLVNNNSMTVDLVPH